MISSRTVSSNPFEKGRWVTIVFWFGILWAALHLVGLVLFMFSNAIFPLAVLVMADFAIVAILFGYALGRVMFK